MGSESLALIEQHLPGKRALVLGPGMGLHPAAAELVLHLYNTTPLPMALDADALTLLARHKGQMLPPPGPRIFTPHPGELARMLGVTVATVQADRIGAASSACQLFDQATGRCSFILKGAGTVIASSDGPIWINTSGNPGMATGGMGDVLSGMIGAFLGQGLDPQEAACAAVYLHGAAGDRLLRRMGVGYTASELADTVPHCMKAISKLSRNDSSLGSCACQCPSPELENF
jgi:NAD(P)H-hydrate epimerase